MAMAADWLAATAEPALNPNQPTHKMAPPRYTSITLWGGGGSLWFSLTIFRLPMISVDASPATPLEM